MEIFDDFSFGDTGGDVFDVGSHADIFSDTVTDSVFDAGSWYTDTDLSWIDDELMNLSFDDSWTTNALNGLGAVGNLVKPAAGLLGSVINSPTAMGMMGGAAEGYQNQQYLDLKEKELDAVQAEVDRKKALNEKHHASLQNPHEDITKRIRRI